MQVLVGAAASLALIIVGTLVMDWYQLAPGDVVGDARTIAIDLRSAHICALGHVCVTASLTPLPGMFPTLAAVTLWSSLGFAALVAFQAGAYVLTGNAMDALSKLGYVLALGTISLAVATAYMFGLEPEGIGASLAMQVGITLHRTWAPLILLAGHVAGFMTIYMTVDPESGDVRAAHRSSTLVPARTTPGERARIPSRPLTALSPSTAGTASVKLSPSTAGTASVKLSPSTAGTASVKLSPSAAGTASVKLSPSASGTTSVKLSPSAAGLAGAAGSTSAAGASGTAGSASIARTELRPAVARPSVRTKTGPIPPVPEHLRNRLSYVAITAELTAGGIDARREDGSSRLVLWRDVVGVVARRMPPAYDDIVFIDIVSTAGSTLRIVSWTRLTGDPIAAGADAWSWSVVKHVVARCPDAKVDPATQQFLDTGEAAQLPDRETLQAHDDRLA
jgi:hypothetical protein